jgi:hypothetical protein
MVAVAGGPEDCSEQALSSAKRVKTRISGMLRNDARSVIAAIVTGKYIKQAVL